MSLTLISESILEVGNLSLWVVLIVFSKKYLKFKYKSSCQSPGYGAIKNSTDCTMSNKYRCAACKWNFMSVKLIRSLTAPSLVLERILFLSNVLQPFRPWHTVHHVQKKAAFRSRRSKLPGDRVTKQEGKICLYTALLCFCSVVFKVSQTIPSQTLLE